MSFFTSFYNKVFSFFKPQEVSDNNVKEVARSRLKLVLMQDRTNLTPKILEQMRGELVDLLSKYVELDKNLLELNFEQEGDQVALMLSIPVIRAKDEKEIEEALKKDALLKGIKLAEDEDDADAATEENESVDTAEGADGDENCIEDSETSEEAAQDDSQSAPAEEENSSGENSGGSVNEENTPETV